MAQVLAVTLHIREATGPLPYLLAYLPVFSPTANVALVIPSFPVSALFPFSSLCDLCPGYQLLQYVSSLMFLKFRFGYVTFGWVVKSLAVLAALFFLFLHILGCTSTSKRFGDFECGTS
jgi:hypothetical protein